MRLWLDVEDLFHYAVNNLRPSGIQRLSFELYAELRALLGDDVRFCRHDPVAGTLRTVPWEAIQDLFDHLLAPRAVARPVDTPAPGRPERPLPGLRRLFSTFPLAVRDPLVQAVISQRLALSAQGAVLRHGGRVVRALPAFLRRPPGTSAAAGPGGGQGGGQEAGVDIRDLVRPGDIFCVLGSPWFHPNYASFVRGVTGHHGLRTALLVYDLIPLVRPEWCEQGLVRVFRDWLTNFIPHVSHVFAISDASARDVARWAARSGVPVRLPVRTLPIGSGFSGPPPPPGDAAAAPLPAGIEPGRYALFVSTVEARKNHLLAFRVWRRMVDEMPPGEVPTLVLAGRVGWMVGDLMQQLANCNYLDGKVVLVQAPSDSQLAALYRGARFTLFPSLYEGWGLPVTESLFFGKLCVASDRTAVPEAGGPFCLYVDPENATAAYETIRRACTDDALVAGFERRIRDEFRPVPWRRTAEALVQHLREGGAADRGLDVPGTGGYKPDDGTVVREGRGLR